MRQNISLIVMIVGLVGAAMPAQAGSWIFQRSYYSHYPATPVEVGPRVARGPYYTRPYGEYVRGGYRNVRSTINIGPSYDQAQFYESWIQVGGQN